ncbi:MAG: malate dehydrogenase (quinone) [Gallionellaceae bacterium]|jgi:malate dehydrogenase (quinone)|nr:malate dehydrogenase (quinone) [Gallionellaceae bacterium]
MTSSHFRQTDILLIGAGIMSATLGQLLNQLDPTLRILMVERLSGVALESSDGPNNAGTGHAGYCELNYTPRQSDGGIDIRRAAAINEAFQISLQFWNSLVERGTLPSPASFINPVPHQSFVQGAANVAFLRQRWEALRAHPLFANMEYSDAPEVLRGWMPLVMQNRNAAQAVAATQVKSGADIDFGSLARSLVDALQKQPAFELKLNHTVANLAQQANGHWRVTLEDARGGGQQVIDAGFVFIGAGGGTLPLLQKSGIPESRGYGGFPVGGQWLICNNPEVVKQHSSKVYGMAPVGAPPMSVPHLDARILNGQPSLLFGPFAGATTRFLKQGSVFDLLASVTPQNLCPMFSAARDNFDLTRYLVAESLRSHESRIASLREFYAGAKAQDWTLATAGQRVQIIRRNENSGGKLEFGTEIVTSRDGTLAALLGASPGASTSVQAMLEVLERCFAGKMPEWREAITALIPSYGVLLTEDMELLEQVKGRVLNGLGLTR